MTGVHSEIRLYLVRHGEAKSKDEDPERGLTEAGRANVNKMAAWAAAAGVRVDEIRHSGKLRSQQTAEIFADNLGAKVQAVSGMAPNDDVAGFADAIQDEQRDIMLVGHLPFLERLAALLIVGSDESAVVSLDAGALLELIRADEGWAANCLMRPKLLPGS